MTTKELIRAEIERRLAAYQKNFDKADNKIAKLSTDGRIASLKGILPFITSLQHEQPEVNLEKEIERYLLDNADLFILADSKTVVQALARHFYELGQFEMRKRIANPEYNRKVIASMEEEQTTDLFNAREEE